MADSGVDTGNENSDNSLIDLSHNNIEFNLPAIPLPQNDEHAELMEESSSHDFVGKIKCPPKFRCKYRFGSIINSSKQHSLRTAASTNNYDLAEKLLKEGVDPNTSDEHKRSPLHLAACRGYIELVKLLIKYGANPNIKDSLGNTPLHLAACSYHIAVVTELLDAGTDVTSNDRYGRNPIQLALNKLRLIQSSAKKWGNTTETRKIIDEFYMVVNMMVKYLKIQKEDAGELELVRDRLEKVSTREDVDNELQSLLNNLNTLHLR